MSIEITGGCASALGVKKQVEFPTKQEKVN